MLIDKFDASSGTNKINELRERLKTRSLLFSALFSARHQPLLADAVAVWGRRCHPFVLGANGGRTGSLAIAGGVVGVLGLSAQAAISHS